MGNWKRERRDEANVKTKKVMIGRWTARQKLVLVFMTFMAASSTRAQKRGAVRSLTVVARTPLKAEKRPLRWVKYI